MLTHLHVLVFVLEVHEPMVGSDSLTELTQVYTHGNEILPDLPSLIITLERFLKGAERLLPATHTHMKQKHQCVQQKLLMDGLNCIWQNQVLCFSPPKRVFGKLAMWESVIVLFQKPSELPAYTAFQVKAAPKVTGSQHYYTVFTVDSRVRRQRVCHFSKRKKIVHSTDVMGETFHF